MNIGEADSKLEVADPPLADPKLQKESESDVNVPEKCRNGKARKGVLNGTKDGRYLSRLRETSTPRSLKPLQPRVADLDLCKDIPDQRSVQGGG